MLAMMRQVSSTERSESTSSGDQCMDRKCSTSRKVCRVCGDKAFSVNFNVITCESCKAFFRRNALKPKEFRCPLNGRCQINVFTRRQCKKCRLDKCFQVGMVKDFIMSDEARMRKRHLIEENRAKRRMVIERKLHQNPLEQQQHDGHGFVKQEDNADRFSESHCSMNYYEPNQFDNSTPFESDYSTPPTVANNACTISEATIDNCSDTISVPKSVLTALINQCHNAKIDNFCNHNGYCLEKRTKMTCTCRCICGANASLTWPTGNGHPQTDQNRDCRSGCMDKNESSLVIRNNMERKTSIPPKQLLKMLYSSTSDLEFDSTADRLIRFDFGLSAAKSSHFDSLKYAFQCLYDRWDQVRSQDYSKSLVLYEDKNLPPVVSQMACLERYHDIIRRLARICKRIHGLRYINVMDQIRLVKGALNGLMAIRGVHAYLPEADGWLHTGPLGPPTPCSVLKVMIRKNEAAISAYNAFRKFALEFPRSFISDDKIFVSIAAIVLFNPECADLEDKLSVQLLRGYYENMLYHYLVTSYGTDIGTDMSKHVLQIARKVQMTAHEFVWNAVVELEPNDLEPLLIEIPSL